jgi:hypothetical protein
MLLINMVCLTVERHLRIDNLVPQFNRDWDVTQGKEESHGRNVSLHHLPWPYFMGVFGMK